MLEHSGPRKELWQLEKHHWEKKIEIPPSKRTVRTFPPLSRFGTKVLLSPSCHIQWEGCPLKKGEVELLEIDVIEEFAVCNVEIETLSWAGGILLAEEFITKRSPSSTQEQPVPSILGLLHNALLLSCGHTIPANILSRSLDLADSGLWTSPRRKEHLLNKQTECKSRVVLWTQCSDEPTISAESTFAKSM